MQEGVRHIRPLHNDSGAQKVSLRAHLDIIGLTQLNKWLSPLKSAECNSHHFCICGLGRTIEALA